jgi:1-pyrroline-5-carboxylate dehydrogenase
LQQLKRLKQGTDFDSFCGPVIHRVSFDKIKNYIKRAKADGLEVVAGGTCIHAS